MEESTKLQTSTVFKKAQRQGKPLKIAIQGVSFSGKTMSAIKLAKGLAGDKPVLLIDTENDSATLYDFLDFYHTPLRPPFKPVDYIAKIREAVECGAGCIITDSFSHAWEFILNYKDELDRNKQGFNNWSKVKPLWKSLKDAILQSPVHIIVCLRERADYAIEETQTDKGKKSSIKKLGTKAIAEEGTEYEFSVVWKLDRDTHIATVEKDRTGLFDGRSFIIDEGIGIELRNWLEAASGGIQGLEEGPEWKLIAEGESEEFRAASADADRLRKDTAKQILNRLRIITSVSQILSEHAKTAGSELSTLIIDGDRYGATTAEKMIRYIAEKLGSFDPVPVVKMQLDALSTVAAEKQAQSEAGKKTESKAKSPWAVYLKEAEKLKSKDEGRTLKLINALIDSPAGAGLFEQLRASKGADVWAIVQDSSVISKVTDVDKFAYFVDLATGEVPEEKSETVQKKPATTE